MVADKSGGDDLDRLLSKWLDIDANHDPFKDIHLQKMVDNGDIESLTEIVNSGRLHKQYQTKVWNTIERAAVMSRLPKAVMNAAKGTPKALMHARFCAWKKLKENEEPSEQRESRPTPPDIYTRMQILNECEYLSPESIQSLFTLAAACEAASKKSGEDRTEQAFDEAFRCVIDNLEDVCFKELTGKAREERHTNPLQGDGVLGESNLKPKAVKPAPAVRFPRLRRLFKCR